VFKNYLSLIKFSHSIFAMPFALLGYFLGTLQSGGSMNIRLLIGVILCMIFARSAAMAFNRWLDSDFDKKNPRTAIREIPSGVIAQNAALFFVIGNCLLFMATTYFINPLCLMLAPVALAVVLGYSYTKRFTALCHFVLGLGLSLAPIGAFLAVTGEFKALPLLYSAAVLLWTAGFDVIYALQDEDFDRSENLHSIPAWLGGKNALRLSEVAHVISASLMVYASYILTQQYPQFGWLHWLGVALYSGFLLYQHLIVKPNDLSRVNLAFFTLNGMASIIFCGFVILDMYF
jgi:4-hydroxybenzoate polyprenyltransferase